jgi:hypothetical protein
MARGPETTPPPSSLGTCVPRGTKPLDKYDGGFEHVRNAYFAGKGIGRSAEAMADENMQEFGTNAQVEQATIRAVVEAYAEGKIELEKPKGEGKDSGLRNVRNAPSFLPARNQFNDLKLVPKPYNAESIARFLGWWSGDQVSLGTSSSQGGTPGFLVTMVTLATDTAIIIRLPSLSVSTTV